MADNSPLQATITATAPTVAGLADALYDAAQHLDAVHLGAAPSIPVAGARWTGTVARTGSGDPQDFRRAELRDWRSDRDDEGATR